MRYFLLLTLPFLLLFCQPKTEEAQPELVILQAKEEVDILALGDSYTKGQSVPAAMNFPNQLADSLVAEGRLAFRPKIIAQTGWRTDDLMSAINAQSSEIGDSVFSLVTLCIGVNNQYQNANFDTYKVQFEQLLQIAIERTGGRKNRVIVLSIPDWAYTPYGQGYSADPSTISQKIDAYNLANQTIASNYGVQYVDVTDISRLGLADPELIAFDGLHPSAEQYSAWLHVLLPAVRIALED